MADERLKQIKKQDGVYYASGSPLLLEAGALYLDKTTSNTIIQLKWRNIDQKTVKAVMIDVVGIDAFSQRIEPVHFQYDEVTVNYGATFGEKTAILIKNDKVKSYDVILKAVSFIDGTIWRPDSEEILKPLPAAKQLPLDKDLLAQYQRDLSQQGIKCSASYQPQNALGLWQCCCGSWQCENQACINCKATPALLSDTADKKQLEQHLAEYLIEQDRIRIETEKRAEEARIAREKAEKERIEKEEAERQERERQAEQVRKKHKRNITIGASIAVVCIALAIVLITVIIPNGKYNAAVDLYNAGKYDEAITAFSELNGYRDSNEQVAKCKYYAAKALIDTEDYEAAYKLLKGLDYEDSSSILLSIEPKYQKILFSRAKVGSYVIFGHYEQDNNTSNGQEAIEWVVIDYDARNNRVMLISRYGLDVKPYNSKKADITWENCTLRTWLNEEFLSTSFSTEEQSAILITTVDNGSKGFKGWSTQYSWSNITGGKNTEDKVFLLNYTEANKYLGVQSYGEAGGDSARVVPTAFAIKNGAYISDKYTMSDGNKTGEWWLRSPGLDQDYAVFACANGSTANINVNDGNNCVRPVLWLNLGSDIF